MDFLEDISKTLLQQKFTLGLHYNKGEIFYSFTANTKTYSTFESQFYTHFNNFQIVGDDKNVWSYDKNKSVIGEIKLANDWFFPFKMDDEDNSDFVFNMFRTFENFDVINDKIGLFVEMKPVVNESFLFFIKSKFLHGVFKWKLAFNFYKYMFNHKIQKDWKSIGHKYFKDKLQNNLFETKLYFIVQSQNKATAEGRIKSMFNNFLVFKNYPLNQFHIKIHKNIASLNQIKDFNGPFGKFFMNSREISSFFHFPKNPKNETSLLTVRARKLALPIGIPTFEYDVANNGEIMAKNYPQDINIMGISDYRSIKVPIGIYDDDRLRHMYVVGKTGTGKSKFLLSLMINDIKQGKGIGVIDPHGDAIEEIMMHIPASRKQDVIIFDPTDDQYPFCFNPLDVQENESKQVLAK